MRPREDGRLTVDVGLEKGGNDLRIRIATTDGLSYRSIDRAVVYAEAGLQIARVSALTAGECGGAAIAGPTSAEYVCVDTTREATLTRDGVPVDGAIVRLRPGANTLVAQAGGELRLCHAGQHVSHGPAAPVGCSHAGAMTVSVLLPQHDAMP